MFKNVAALMMCSVLAAGCAYEVDGEDVGEEPIDEVESALLLENALAPNALTPNALTPNALTPNALTPNALTPNALSADALATLKIDGLAGELSRMAMKYIVSCSLTPAQSFSFSWTDSQLVVHNETYVGSVGLAPDWATRALTETEQKWVTACLGARTNYYSISVMISMRGSKGALAVDSNERTSWSHKEGAFWGNVFAATPFVRSCHNPAEVSHARSKQRDCAAGHWDGASASNCGMLDRRGSCDTLCTAPTVSTDGFTECEGATEVITTFLAD